MRNKGVTNVYALLGGFEAWQTRGYPTASGGA